MKREEILKLIEEKEAKDVETKARFASIEKRTEEVFHIIKQDVMDMVVENCVEWRYSISHNFIHRLIFLSMIHHKDFPLNESNCEIKSMDGYYYLEGNTEAALRFMCSIDTTKLVSYMTELMVAHGFKEEFSGSVFTYTTTKENLLSFSEIISEDVGKDKKRFAQAPPPVRYDAEDDDVEGWVAPVILILTVALFILLTSVYLFS